ncbi:MAG: hypothetical protein CSA62_12375 [Planctomycetota bacterium]|nr:MAG: hypothetical protein CSA62_12375 [Planctomycetota bacterium]
MTLRPALALIAFSTALLACRQENTETAPPSSTAKPSPGKQIQQEEETPRQRSHRLLPVLERMPKGNQADSARLAKPLLRPAPELQVRVRWILRKPGANSIPSQKQLAEMEALGHPLSELAARNLRDRFRRFVSDGGIGAVGGKDADGKRQVLMLRFDHQPFGVHSLLLIEEFWQLCEQQLGGPVWVIAPDRQLLHVLPRAPEQQLRAAAGVAAHLFSQGTDPIFDRAIGRKGKQLIAGPSFAELSKPSK